MSRAASVASLERAARSRQQVVTDQARQRRFAPLKRAARLLGDLEKAVSAIREIQHPQEGHLHVTSPAMAAKARIQPAPAKLWFAFGIQIAAHRIAFDHFENGQTC